MTTSESEPGPHGLAFSVLTPVVVAVAVIAGTLAALGGGSDATNTAVAPLELAAVSESVAQHYHSAVDLEDVYRQVPCYCGCVEFLGHRHLYDCFVRADGQGWDAHAARCGVCIAESTMVRNLTAAGAATEDIPAAVIDRFGTTPITSPPT